MQLPVVNLSFNYDDQVENQSKSIAFSMNAEQFAVLLAGKIFFEFSIKSPANDIL